MAFGLSSAAASLIGGVAAPVVGGLLGSNAASQGYDAQRAASDKADATLRYQYDTTRADNAPFLNNGVAASNKLASLLGLSGGSQKTYDQLRSELIGQYTGNRNNQSGYNNGTPGAWSNGGVASTQPAPLSQVSPQNQNYLMGLSPADRNTALRNGGYWMPGAGSWDNGSPPSDTWVPFGNATSSGVDEQGLEAAIQARLAQQRQEQTSAQSDPSYGSLLRSATRADLLSDPTLVAENGYFAPLHDFGQADLNKDLVYQNGLQFGLDNGNNAINRQAAATGSQLSGATLKALTRFGNDYATTKTGDAYSRFTNAQNTKYSQLTDASNRFTNNQTNMYNRLAGLAGSGQTAGNTVTSDGANMAKGIANNATNLGNAAAASGIAGSNALSGGLSSAYNNYSNNLLNTLRGGSGYNTETGSNFFDGTGAWRTY